MLHAGSAKKGDVSRAIKRAGKVIAEAGDEQRILTAEIAAETVRDWRRDFPVLRDIRCAVSLPAPTERTPSMTG